MWYGRGMTAFTDNPHTEVETLTDFLLLNITIDLEIAEAAASTVSTSPTGSKNAGWVHAEIRGNSAPAYGLLQIREWSPEKTKAQLTALKNLVTQAQHGGEDMAAVRSYLEAIAASYGWSN
jgi:hypothetical protein